MKVCPHVYQMQAWCQGRQKRASDPVKLKLHIVVSCHVWVLGTKPASSPSIASALNYEAISLHPC